MKLRKLQEKDAHRIFEWMVDPEVNRYFRFNPGDVRIDEIIRFIDSAQNTKENLHLACVDENDQYMGTVSLKEISKQNKKAEYAISFRKDSHGTGAARFATCEILRIGFEELDLERIYLNVPSSNFRAIAFYEKMHFVFEGEFRRHLFIRNEWISLRWYALLRPEWENLKKRDLL